MKLIVLLVVLVVGIFSYLFYTEVLTPLKKQTKLFPSFRKERIEIEEAVISSNERRELQSLKQQLEEGEN